MAESVTISTALPDFKSMQYDFLRQEGLKHIQELAGKVWTDYNLSDPGITMLEVLSYVITDLGYRANYPIQDIVALAPNDHTDIKNFYTARQILPMYPVTFNDYRKLLMDVEVSSISPGCELVGVKNAWIDIVNDNEVPFYLDQAKQALSYTPESAASPERVLPKVLYNVLLELGECEEFGDLNETILEAYVVISPCPGNAFPAALTGLKIKVLVEFPRWDDEGIDFNDVNQIRNHIKRVTLDFPKLPPEYRLDSYKLNADKTVSIYIYEGTNLVDCTCMETQIDALMFTGPNSMTALYKLKVQKVLDIMAAARQRLMQNRNLGEDFFKINTLKVEEIALCADIQVAADADIEKTEARIYFEIQQFFSPTVYFYTLDEMYAKGKTTEEIFDGPPLLHGFIDDTELASAKRRKSIHVSDLIHIIMGIEGVIAVKKIQIANIPEDNDDNIPSVSVRWCLDLAFDKNYIPRLTTELSKIVFYKDLLPYSSDPEEVDELLEQLEENARPQRIENAVVDLPVPAGEYKNIEDYVSTQDEFPLAYGIGPEGLPTTATDLRKAQAKQLKGFLMFFDQLLADYLSQLNGVKELFSMNGKRGNDGDFEIHQSYFTQSLVPSVTDATLLLAKSEADYTHDIQAMSENQELFNTRRNKFLDHLMARFSEQFTDYAMMVYRLNGKKGTEELLNDKLELLNAYPEISSGRFRGFDYTSHCALWSVDNRSGFEERVSLLNGVATKDAAELQFGLNFTLTAGGFTISDDSQTSDLLQNAILFTSKEALKLDLEKVVLNGFDADHYTIISAGGGFYKYQLLCGDEILGESAAIYPSQAMAQADIDQLMPILQREFYNNPEANRNDLACPIKNYVSTTTVVTNMVPDPPTYSYNFTLYKDPFDFSVTNTALLTGTYAGKGQAKEAASILSVNAANHSVLVSDSFAGKILLSNPQVSIKNSLSNNGDYTIISISTPVGGQIEIKLSGSNPLITTAPLGDLYYNTQSAADLAAMALSNQNEALFEILYTGKSAANYNFNTTPNYSFNVIDRCKDVLATSVENNFNTRLAQLIASHPTSHKLPVDTTSIQVVGNSTANDGVYAVTAAVAQNDLVKVSIAEALQPIAGGNLVFDGTYDITGVDLRNRTVVLTGVLNRIFFPGDTVELLADINTSKGSYTISEVNIVSGNTELVMEELIDASVASGYLLYYVKQFVITNIVVSTGSDIYVQCNTGIQVVQEMADFITAKFFGHEGMHLVEHVLLRPKINGSVYFPMDSARNNELVPGLVPAGNVEYTKFFNIGSIDLVNNCFNIFGDKTSEIKPLSTIIVKGSTDEVNDNTYKGLSVTYKSVGNITQVKVLEPIPSNALASLGALYFRKVALISSVPSGTHIYINEKESNAVSLAYPAVITASFQNKNNGTYRVSAITNVPGQPLLSDMTFDEVLTPIHDNFLLVNLKDDCDDCRIEDPYSFIGSVVLPYWQGRFINQDFRQFFERSLRTECPAHIALNICWVSCDQMEDFEKKYKAWLVENARQTPDLLKRTQALNALIDTLVALRSVYPTGVLHDCDSDPELQNSIILNRTVIGSIQL